MRPLRIVAWVGIGSIVLLMGPGRTAVVERLEARYVLHGPSEPAFEYSDRTLALRPAELMAAKDYVLTTYAAHMRNPERLSFRDARIVLTPKSDVLPPLEWVRLEFTYEYSLDWPEVGAKKQRFAVWQSAMTGELRVFTGPLSL